MYLRGLSETVSALPLLPDYQVHTFANGIRLVHKQVPNTRIVHCGFILDIGSRDENPEQVGMAHFWEHMAFKGTRKRKAFHVLNRLEVLGGEINAYTTKEKIAFHASVLADHFPKAADLLCDITFFSTFPEKEIEKEKNVILEEMAMYEDDPDDSIHDDFDQLLFPGHALGNNILGTNQSVKSFSRPGFLEFFETNMNTSRLVFSVVGPFDLPTTLRKAGPGLEKLPRLEGGKERAKPGPLVPVQTIRQKPIQQAHVVLGCRAYSLRDSRRLAFFVLNNLLGGPALNSRLNMNLREKHGLVYHVESNFSPYLDTGAFSVYLGTEARNLEKAVHQVEKEIRHLTHEKLSPTRLRYAREQIKGQLAMAEEGNQMLMLLLGKSILDLNRVESLAEIFAALDAIQPETLWDVAQEVWNHDNWVRLTFLPDRKPA
jgi:predicted Zn-dependent peptidase